MKGEQAAKTFYDTELFKRKGVTPNLVKATLFGKGGVQGLDGAAHVYRKQMFMSLMSEEGNLLDEQIAAVEVINVLRPTVAVSRFIIFCALALHQYPEYRKKNTG